MTDSTSAEEVVIKRDFEAPLDVIWQMWTEPDLFKNWYGPKGASVPIAEFDLVVGGQRFVCMEMETPQGTHKMCTVGEHLEIKPKNRLAYTEAHSDDEGNRLPPGPGQPAQTKVIIGLEDLGGRTRMTLRHEGIPADSPGKMGWEQAFDKLAQQAG